MPQPVEIRMHCLRAVRDRLPRGEYVMLASLAERLGGRVMKWQKSRDNDGDGNSEDSIGTDGGDTRPAATRPVKHGGRYFDRELRFDQNVYQVGNGREGAGGKACFSPGCGRRVGGRTGGGIMEIFLNLCLTLSQAVDLWFVHGKVFALLFCVRESVT